MKRRDLIKKITEASAQAGVAFGEVREGGSHTVYRCGGENVIVPRHNEINEITAKSIMKNLESELGEGWWR